MPRPDVVYDAFGQLQIMLHHLLLVIQLVEFQIITGQQKMHLLAVLLPVQFGQFTPQLGQFNATADGTARINHLPSLYDQVIAEMRHVDTDSLTEVPVPQSPVAQIRSRHRSRNVGQTLCLGRFQGFVGSLLACLVSLYALTVRVSQAKHFFHAHRTLLGIHVVAA